MKPLLSALVVTLSLTAVASPVLAQSIDMSSRTPTLTYPEPATPGPVTQSESGIDK